MMNFFLMTNRNNLKMQQNKIALLHCTSFGTWFIATIDFYFIFIIKTQSRVWVKFQSILKVFFFCFRREKKKKKLLDPNTRVRAIKILFSCLMRVLQSLARVSRHEIFQWTAYKVHHVIFQLHSPISCYFETSKEKHETGKRIIWCCQEINGRD